MTSVTAFGANGRSASAAARFSSSIDAIAASRAPEGAIPSRCGLEHDPGAERLREEERVSGSSAGLRPDGVRMHRAHDCEAVLRLVVADRVPTGQDRARGPHALVRAGEDVTEHLDRKLFRKRRDGEREQRRATHREHVVQRIRRGDRAERARVVDERREEVDGEDDRALVVEPVDSGVVGRIEPDEQILLLRRDEPREERLEASGRVLGGAAARAGERRERDGLHAKV